MRHFSRTLVSALTFAIFIGLGPFAACADDPPTKAQIDGAIGQLSAPTYEARQQASQLLGEAGDHAIPALSGAAKSNDLELAVRCTELLARLAHHNSSKPALEALEALANDDSLRVSSRAARIVSDLSATEQELAVAALEASGARLGRNGNNNEVLWAQLSDDTQAYYVQYIPSLRMLQLMGRNITDDCLKYASKAKQVSSLYISDTSITSDGLASLKTMPSLTQISLMQHPFTGAGLSALQELPRLSNLSLRDCPIDSDFSFLAKIPNLNSISLGDMELGELEVQSLNSVNKLRMVQLSLTDVDDARLKAVSQLNSQVYLHLQRCKLVTEEGWRHLADARLTGLYMYMTPIEDEHLAHIGKITTLRSLSIYKAPITDAGLKHLKGLTSLSSLNLRDTKATDEGIAELKKSLPRFARRGPVMPNLKKLHLSSNTETGATNAHVRGALTPATIKELKQVPKLDSVYLSNSAKDDELPLLKDLKFNRLTINSRAITGKGLQAIQDHPTLHSISIYSVPISDDGLDAIAKIPSLDTALIYGAKITDAGLQRFLATLADAGKMKTLSFYRCQDISNDGFAEIDKLKTLEQLLLNQNPKLTSSLLAKVAQLKRLQRLSLDEIKLVEADLAHLEGLIQLQSLSLSSTNMESTLTDEGMRVIGKLSSLESLMINKSKVTDASAAMLGKLTNLQRLGLANTKVTDQTLQQIAGSMPKLEYLSLKETQVTNGVMPHLGKLTELEWLWVDKTKVGGDGLTHLKALKKLKYLYIDAANVTSAQHRQFAKEHPETQVQLQ